MEISSLKLTELMGFPQTYSNRFISVMGPPSDAPGKKPETEKAKSAKRESPPDTEKVRQMVENIQSHISNLNVCFTLSEYGEDRENVCIKVTERDTGKVIREIPPKELQDLYAKMNEIAGIIFSNTI